MDVFSSGCFSIARSSSALVLGPRCAYRIVLCPRRAHVVPTSSTRLLLRLRCYCCTALRVQVFALWPGAPFRFVFLFLSFFLSFFLFRFYLICRFEDSRGCVGKQFILEIPVEWRAECEGEGERIVSYRMKPRRAGERQKRQKRQKTEREETRGRGGGGAGRPGQECWSRVLLSPVECGSR